MRAKFVISILCASLVAVVSCSDRGTRALEQHTQFSLDIGKSEDQIDLIQLPGEAFRQKIRLHLHNGLFYISNGNAHKIMKFSSYGDLLTLFYNVNENPTPVLVATTGAVTGSTNKRGFPFPFREVGEIAVSVDGVLYAEDRVEAGAEEYDDELGTLLRFVIRRFAADGRYLGAIGQEGIDGTPFPYVDRVQVSRDGDLAVIARTREHWLVYWYSSDGRNRGRAVVTDENLPGVSQGVLAASDAIHASPDERIVNIKVDYYRVQDGESGGGSRQNVEFLQSTVLRMDPLTGEYIGTVDLPRAYFTSGTAELFNRREDEVRHQFLGVSEGGTIFLLSPARVDVYQLTVLDRTGMVVYQTELFLDDEVTVYRDFHVSREGIVAALIGEELKVDLALWRTDRAVRGVQR